MYQRIDARCGVGGDYTCEVVFRRFLIFSCVVSAVAASGVAVAHGKGSVRPAGVRVSPAAGSPSTSFSVSFRAPERTGRYGSTERQYVVTATAATASAGCVPSMSTRVGAARAGERVRVLLEPGKLGGSWCAGRYHGKVQEIQTAVCPRGKVCPSGVVVRATLGRFALRVTPGAPSGGGPGGNTTPPSFAGLESAVACTPGAQRPGETTPFNLSWQAATDDVTPSSQIVYDIYTAISAGGENFASPTWTTPPGVTSYRTAGLPSHGAIFFVVRARDAAGNEDRNTRERQGIDRCY
jgi:hypothetical protein